QVKIVNQTLQVNSGKTHIPQRVISLYDPDARPIQKGKLKSPTEFGYKTEITENEDRLVTDYKIHIGNPSDESLLLGTVRRHIENTGRIPYSLSTVRRHGKCLKPLWHLGFRHLWITYRVPTLFVPWEAKYPIFSGVPAI
ncbi:Transposase, IS5, partial [Acididesulfobacillus acetoxydans]